MLNPNDEPYPSIPRVLCPECGKHMCIAGLSADLSTAQQTICFDNDDNGDDD